MEDEKEIERDRQRAEVFDALGHPTRIAILKALSEGPIGFADLKKKTAIDSSGHLQHHLTKLNGLIKTDEFGKYCLSEQGKDALLTVQTVENIPRPNRRERMYPPHLSRTPNLKLKSLGLILIVSLLIATSVVAVFEYNQVTGLSTENSFLNATNPQAAAFYSEFGAIIPIVNVNSSFAPPITVYQALQIAFENQSLNKQNLKGMVVWADFSIGETVNMSGTDENGKAVTAYGTNITQQLTAPSKDYSDFTVNGTNYQYIWEIQTHYSDSRTIPPLGFTLTFVDASTGKVLPNMMHPF